MALHSLAQAALSAVVRIAPWATVVPEQVVSGTGVSTKNIFVMERLADQTSVEKGTLIANNDGSPT